MRKIFNFAFVLKVLITGAAGGIGYLTALTLAERGYDVYLTCHTNKEVLNTKEKLDDYKNINVLKVDVTKEDDVKKVLSLDVDVLVSNAAKAVGGSIIELDEKKIKDNFEVNVFSNFALIKKVLRQMVEKDSGRIIVMSSLASVVPIPFGGVYSATKASITAMVKSLQKELFLMGTNVKVVLVEPGLYHTGFNQVLVDSKYNNGKYFNDIEEELYNLEHSFLRLFEVKKLDSVVIRIVRAIEDENPKSTYKVPFIQSKLAKIYSMFK